MQESTTQLPENPEKEVNKSSPDKKPKLIRRFIRFLLWLLLLLLVMLAVVLLQPNLIRQPLQKWLSYQNIPLEVTDIQSSINFDTISFTSTVNYRDRWVQVDESLIKINSDWQRLFAPTAKFDITLEQTKAIIELTGLENKTDKQTASKDQAAIIRQLFNFKENQATIDTLLQQIKNSKLAWVGNWRINDALITYQNETYIANLNGQSNKEAHLSLATPAQTLLALAVDLENKKLIIDADAFVLHEVGGTTAQIKTADLRVDLSDILASRFNADLAYNNIDTEIQLLPATDSSGFVVQLDNKSLSEQPITLNVKAEETTIAVLFDELPLSILTQLKSFIPGQAPYETVAGRMDGNIVFDYETNRFINSSVRLTDVAVKSQFINLSTVDANIDIDADKVVADIALNSSKLQLPGLFLATEAKEISGSGQVEYSFSEQKITFSNVEVHSADFASATAEGYVQIQDKVLLDIRGTGQGIDLSKTRDYLPYQIMTEELIAWLSAAFVKGTANDLTFEIASADAENMFYHDSLKLDIRTEVSDTDFLFIENNPIIHVNSGSVAFHNKQLDIVSEDASIGNVPLKSHAWFDDLTQPVLELKVTTEARKIEQLLAVAEQSLVKEAVEQTKAQLLLDGEAAIDLSLSYDFLNGKEAFEVGVLASKADIALVAYPMLDISEAEVDVKINNDGLQTVQAEAIFNKFQANIDIVNESGNLKGKLQSSQPVEELFQKLTFINKDMRDYTLKEKVITGMTNLDVDFTLNNKNDLTHIDIHSDLVGAKLNLFSAVVKPANEALPLDFRYDLSQQQLTLTLGDEFNLLANLKKQAFLISNNRISAKKLPSNYVEVDIDFPALDLSKAIDFYHVLGSEETKEVESVVTEAYKKFSGSINLNVGAVNYHDIEIPNFKFSGQLNENYKVSSALFDVSAQNLATELFVTVEFIDIGQVTKLIKSADVGGEGYSGRQVKMTESTLHKNLPPLTVNVKNIIMNGKTVATATLKSSKKDGRYSIDELYISGSDFIFELSAYEAIDMDSLVTQSQATFRSDEVGKVLLAFGFDDVIDADSLDLQFNLTWPGGIERLDLENSYGQATLDAENLSIEDVSTGVGNLLGLIDIFSIVKTIMLDIGQLMSSELLFSEVEGRWNIGGGRAQTRKFHANGSVVRLVASGGLDIHRKEYDFVKLLIIPKASNTLPIIGAVAGGVVGGIAALAIQQAFGDNIDRVVGIPYTLSGTWLGPKLTLGYQKDDKRGKERDLFNEQNFGDK